MNNDELYGIKGTVINIQHYCYHDGPGVRTTVFLKGCSFSCKWCGNPESICPSTELAYDKKDCLGKEKCGICLKAPFPQGIFSADDEDDGRIKVNWEKARNWDGKEIDLCPTKALFKYGKEMSVKEIIEEVDKDISFYTGSKGGITISGGEPLLQPDFTAALLEMAHNHGYTTAIESAFNVPWSYAEKVLPHVDTVLHDIKHTDGEIHRSWTGADNKRSLRNIKMAYNQYPNTDFIARTPLIPTVNDNEETIESILAFILPHLNVIKYELMPYHRLGLGKYSVLGKEYEMPEVKLDEEKLNMLRDKIDNAFKERYTYFI